MSQGQTLLIGPEVPSVDVIADKLKECVPDLWNSCYTKHIDTPGNYRGFKAVATTFCAAVVETRINLQNKKLVSNGLLIDQELKKHDYPTYFVSEPLLQGMLRTHPPSGTWESIRFPFPALLFMIPRGLLKEPNGPSIYALGACHFPPFKDSEGIPDWMRDAGGHAYERACVFWLAEPAGVTLHDCTFPMSQPLEPDAKWIDEATEAQVARGNVPDVIVTGDFASRMAGVVANLILVMQARPELVENGGKIGKQLPKTKTDIYRPTFIGKKYQTAIDERADAKGHFTELRWRCGHMKQQRFGKGRLEVKPIWIEPYICRGAGLVREEVPA